MKTPSTANPNHAISEDVQANYAIVATRFNSFIVDRLVDGALDAFAEQGISKDSWVTVARVPGAFELPLAVQNLAEMQVFEAVVALGAIIRGDTPHFDYIADVCARGLSKVSLTFNVPVAFGVLTVDNVEQAEQRSAADEYNKGREAAITAMEMVVFQRQVSRRIETADSLPEDAGRGR